MKAQFTIETATLDEWRSFFVRARVVSETTQIWRTRETPHFNTFQALGIVRKETIHSRWLAFLLNPRETHELGAKFLKLFLGKISDFGGTELTALAGSSWEIRTEEAGTEVAGTDEDRLDITLRCEEHGVAIFIENKVDANFQPRQLERYAGFLDGMAKRFPKRWLVVLAPARHLAKPEIRIQICDVQRKCKGTPLGIRELTYEDDILPCLESVLEGTHSDQLKIFIEHYIKTIYWL